MSLKTILSSLTRILFDKIFNINIWDKRAFSNKPKDVTSSIFSTLMRLISLIILKLVFIRFEI